MENGVRYFNFPIQLLQGFMQNSSAVLRNISTYAVYVRAKESPGTVKVNIAKSCDFFNIKFGNSWRAVTHGESIYKKFEPKSPKAGLNVDIYWDYHDNVKTEFEKVCLLAFLAIKSIVQNHAYCKITNRFLLSRMSGSSKLIDLNDLPPELKPYNNEYQLKKIKNTLREKWGLTTYSRYTRGFWVSFELTLDDLVYEAEKRKKATKDKLYKQQLNSAIEKAMERLNLKEPKATLVTEKPNYIQPQTGDASNIFNWYK